MSNKYSSNIKEKEISGKIYMHRNKINNKVYIGQTYQSNPKKRWGSSGVTYKTNPYFYRAIKKYGWDNFEHIIFPETYSTLEELNQAEEDYIIKYNSLAPNGYNNKTGGDNKLYTEEFSQRLSESHKGQKSWNKGKKRIYNFTTNKLKFIDEDDLDLYLSNGWSKYSPVPIHTTKGYRIVHKDNKTKVIPQDKVEEYLSLGYLLGKPKNFKSSSCKGRKHIHKDGKCKTVKVEDLEMYLKDGWELGVK